MGSRWGDPGVQNFVDGAWGGAGWIGVPMGGAWGGSGEVLGGLGGAYCTSAKLVQNRCKVDAN